jgi:hypothetical protein
VLGLGKCKFFFFKYEGLDNDDFGFLTLLCFQKYFAHIFIRYIRRCYKCLGGFNIVYLEL